MQVEELRDLVINTLEDMKAFDIVTLDVRAECARHKADDIDKKKACMTLGKVQRIIKESRLE